MGEDSSPDLSLKLRRGSSDSRDSFYMDLDKGIDSDIDEMATTSGAEHDTTATPTVTMASQYGRVEGASWPTIPPQNMSGGSRSSAMGGGDPLLPSPASPTPVIVSPETLSHSSQTRTVKQTTHVQISSPHKSLSPGPLAIAGFYHHQYHQQQLPMVRRLSRVEKQAEWRQLGCDALATTLSALYGKLLVVMGTAFPMAEVISTYIPPSFYEAYYLYLYIGSMFFLLYMYVVLIRDKRRIKRERKQAKDSTETVISYIHPIFREVSLKKYDQPDTLQVEDKRDVLDGSKTVYAPEPPYYSNFSYNLLSKKTYCSTLKEKAIFKRTITQSSQQASPVNNLNEIEKYCDFDEHDTEHIIYENVTEKPFDSSVSNRTDFDENQVQNENIGYRDLLNMSFNLHEEHSTSEIRKFQGKIMKKFMNTRVDPCVDFYEYSCGNWRRYNVLPADRATYDTFEIVRENLDAAIKGLLEENVQMQNTSNVTYLKKSLLNSEYSPNDTSDATLKAKLFYKSCMQEDVISKRGAAPLLNILDELGGWPILNKVWNSSSFNLVLLLAKLRLLNNDILIAQWVGPDIKNSKEYIVHIDQTMLGLPAREYFLEESNIKYLKAYRVFILTVVSLMDAKPNVAEKDVDEMIDFEINLAQIMVSTEDRKNISELYLRTDIAALTLYFPQFDWKSYFNVVLGTDIDLMTPVACYCAKFLQDLFYLISNTEPRTLQNYVIWRFVRHRTNNLDDRFSKAKERFYHILFGREKNPPRWQFCVAQVNSDMGMALGSLFVKRYFDKKSKMDTTEITKALSEAFKATLLENDWLDNNTKEYARMKLDHMGLKIGYPDFILDATELSQRYYDVEIHPDYFFENILTILRHLTKVEQKRMGGVVNRTLWSTPPAVVNAYYSRNKNQIMFPAGVLQPPFYNRHFPKALNFGGIGVIIGHEVIHGFDDKGRLFDQEGNLHMWWRESSIEKFYEKSECLIEQYGQYVLPDVRVALDGYLTQGENIADNGGLKQAYRAYEAWVKAHPEADETLPGLDLSGKQLFFLNFAQVWCGQQRIEAAKSRIKTSVHSPGIFRVIGVLSNSEEFSREYHCPKNSPMNPDVKCIIW